MLTGRTTLGVPLKRLGGVKRRVRKNAWIVIANQGGATILSQPDLEIVKRVPGNKRGKQDRFEKTDRPGRTFDSYTKAKHGQAGAPRHSLGEKNTPKELAAETFVASLADVLAAGRLAKKFNELVLVAEPKLLGRLKNALDSETRKFITQIIEKEFPHLKDTELLKKMSALKEISDSL